MGPLSYLKSLFGVKSTSETPATEKLTPREATRLLTEEVTAGYRPTSPLANFYSGSAGTPSLARMLTDVEAMLVHPRVSTTLDYYKGGIAGAKFVLQDASSPEVGKFALAELETFWQRGRQAVQRSYEYGRGGCEIVYSREDGAMRFASAHPVAPLDCRVLTRGSHYAGFRLRGSQPLGTIDLWGASGWMPCKGLWFAHSPRYSRWYGWPRLYAAWRPWKRLAGKDGAEETVDGGVYRFAFAPPIGRYPAQDERVKGPDGSTSQWSNRDKMREMLEHMKAGGVVAFSSRRDESGNYVWDVDWPQGSLDVGGLLVYTDNLEKAISLGVGVPPELIEASEVGSGYSGRAIPLEVFYAGQQHNADALVEVWYRQIGEPLLRFNFGPGSWARITVEDLLKSRMQNLQQSQSQNPPEQPTRPPGQPVQMSTFREEDHDRDSGGKFTSGGSVASGASDQDRGKSQVKGDDEKSKPRYQPNEVPLFDKHHKVASQYAKNMGSLLAQMFQGNYTPEDVLSDVEQYHDVALTAIRREHARFQAHIYDRLYTKYGDEATSYGEMDGIKKAIRKSFADTAEKLDEMTDLVRGAAKSHKEKPMTKRALQAIAGDIANDSAEMANSMEGFNSIMDAVDAFKAKHEPIQTQLSTLRDEGLTPRERWDRFERETGQPVQFSTFREEDHPRADDGRFGRKSGSHSSSDGSQGKAGAPSGETVDNDGYKSQAERSGSKGGKSFDHPEKSTTVQQFVAGKIPRDVVPHSDHLLAGVLSESGRDETPDVVDSHQIDQLHAKGWRMLFRGVSRPEQAEQFRTGEMFSGLGIYGNGTYVAYAKKGFFSNGIVKAKGIADKYAGRRQEPSGGAVLRMALPPDAKIVSHAQIKKEAEEYKDHLRQRLYDREITSEQHDALKHIANDEGRFAALRNYDAIEVKDEGYMVILNRSILAVDRHSY